MASASAAVLASLAYHVQAPTNPEDILQACIDGIEEAEMTRAEALAAELFPDEGQGEAAALPPARSKPPVAAPPGLSAPRQVILQAQEVAVADSAHAGDGRSEEDARLLELLDGLKTVDCVLEASSGHLHRLGPEVAMEILYMVARRHSPSHNVSSNPHMPRLLHVVSSNISKLQSTRSLAQLAWTLGKLENRSHPNSSPPMPGMEACMLHICNMFPDAMAKCSPQDLTNTLWGIARLYPGAASGGAGHWQEASIVAHAIIRRCSQKVVLLTSQCLANSFWAMARLKISGPDVDQYVALALEQTQSLDQLNSFTPQGLANMLWALAQLRVAGVGRDPQEESVRLALIAMATASAKRLSEFQPQELSMVAWSCAKLYEFKKGDGATHSKKSRSSARPTEVDEMLLKLSVVATQHIDKFEDQGISNIAWALATLELVGRTFCHAQARGFMEAAMNHCSTKLWGYSAQAIANLMWACVRMDSAKRDTKSRSSMNNFCSAVAEEMAKRLMESVTCKGTEGGSNSVTWRDLAGVAVALSHWRQKSEQVVNFMTLLTLKTAEWVVKGDITSQQMLNIAQSAARMHVHPESMQPLVDNIEICFLSRGTRLNDVDKRQWGEVQQWCPTSQTPGYPSFAEPMYQQAGWEQQYPVQSSFEHRSRARAAPKYHRDSWPRGVWHSAGGETIIQG